jgi:transcriptional regulator with XRE-family HTH domain
MPRREHPHPLAHELGQRIQRLYQAQGLTMEAFAERCGMKKGQVSNAVRGLSVMKIDTAVRFADALGIPLFMLFASQNDGPKEKLLSLIGRMSPEQCEAAMRIMTPQADAAQPAHFATAHH